MKNKLLISLLILVMAGCTGQKGTDRERLFSDGWKFVRDSIVGAERTDFDDSDWLTVDLPHDFSILPLPGGDSDEQIGHFSKRSEGVNNTGHAVGGTGWYRKTFKVDPKDEGKRFTLVFDGAYMTTSVYVNGKEMGVNKHGYTPFAFDITEALNPATEDNVVAVKVVNYGRNSRWYSGSGLYRDVRLIVADPLHVDLWGAYVTTPEVSKASALVDVCVTLRNDYGADADAEVEIRLIDKAGKSVGSADCGVRVAAASAAVFSKQIKVDRPALWSMDAPNLYEAEIVVKMEGKVKDVYSQRFGIRSIEFSADRGFLLNGEPVLMKGGCLHHDHGLLGANAFRRAERRRVEMMKSNGYNAIRSSHNPPSTHLLEAADELGVLIIDEFTDQWNYYKNHNDYSRVFKDCWENDLTNMMLRDRSHPSVIMWSIGNEIPKASVEEGAEIAKMLRDKVKEIDATRPVTEAICNYHKEGGWDMTKAWMDVLDVCGYNYMEHMYESDHEKYPERVIFGSETFPNKAYENWTKVERLPYVVGDFVWTAEDYLGEVLVANAKYVEDDSSLSAPSVNNLGAYMKMLMSLGPEELYDMISKFATSSWPSYNAWCGDIDLIGEKKPQGLYRDVLWDESVIEVNVHEPVPEGMREQVSDWGWPLEWPSWNWEGSEGKPLRVRVFSKAEQVSLLLNGVEIGVKTIGVDDKYTAVFDVPYQPGTLTAIAFSDGQELGRKELVTAGAPESVKLSVDRAAVDADRGDLSYIRIDVVDKNGLTVPTSDITVKIDVSGDGELVGSGNASADDMESFNRSAVKVFRGQALAIVRPFAERGSISVNVTAEGLQAATASITVK